MSRLLIEDKAIGLIQKELIKENANTMRIFTGGGGCCKRFEIAPVKKALAGDLTFIKGGITIAVEKELLENTECIHIKLDEKKGLILEFPS